MKNRVRVVVTDFHHFLTVKIDGIKRGHSIIQPCGNVITLPSFIFQVKVVAFIQTHTGLVRNHDVGKIFGNVLFGSLTTTGNQSQEREKEGREA